MKWYNISDLQPPTHLQFWDGNPIRIGNLPVAPTKQSTGLAAASGHSVPSPALIFQGGYFVQEAPPGLKCQTTHSYKSAAVSQPLKFLKEGGMMWVPWWWQTLQKFSLSIGIPQDMGVLTKDQWILHNNRTRTTVSFPSWSLIWKPRFSSQHS